MYTYRFEIFFNQRNHTREKITKHVSCDRPSNTHVDDEDEEIQHVAHKVFPARWNHK